MHSHNGVLDQCQRLNVIAAGLVSARCRRLPCLGQYLQRTGRSRREFLAELDRQSGVTTVSNPWIIVLAWLLKASRPASPRSSARQRRNASRPRTAALDVDYSREDWYRLLEARNGRFSAVASASCCWCDREVHRATFAELGDFVQVVLVREFVARPHLLIGRHECPCRPAGNSRTRWGNRRRGFCRSRIIGDVVRPSSTT